MLRLFLIFSSFAFGKPGYNFDHSKKYLAKHLDLFDSKTLYCSCVIKNKKIDLNSCGYKIQSNEKRAARLEWEHIVPAEAFGQSFVEWRDSSSLCIHKGKKYNGRKCAKTNREFRKMEGDLYNLFPEIGELNGLRSNYSMAQLSSKTGKFGNCAVKIEDRKFEPQDISKGIVARTYLNFEHRYPGRGVVSNKNEKLFEAWNKIYPVTALECRRWKILEKLQEYSHLSMSQCKETSNK